MKQKSPYREQPTENKTDTVDDLNTYGFQKGAKTNSTKFLNQPLKQDIKQILLSLTAHDSWQSSTNLFNLIHIWGLCQTHERDWQWMKIII